MRGFWRKYQKLSRLCGARSPAFPRGGEEMRLGRWRSDAAARVSTAGDRKVVFCSSCRIAAVRVGIATNGRSLTVACGVIQNRNVTAH
jgi:hypothetical protein